VEERLVELGLELKLVISELEVGGVEETAEELLKEEEFVEDRLVELGLELIINELEVGVVEETIGE
jgi:hypothetical protein